MGDIQVTWLLILQTKHDEMHRSIIRLDQPVFSFEYGAWRIRSVASKSVQRVGARNTSSFQYDENTFINNVVKKYFGSKKSEILQYFTKYFYKNATLSNDSILYNQIWLAKGEFRKCYGILQTMKPVKNAQGFASGLQRFKEFFIDRHI